MGIPSLGSLGGATGSLPEAAPSVPSAPVANPGATPQSVPQPVQTHAAPTRAQLDAAVQQVQEMMQANSVTLDFSVDHTTGSTVTKVIDRQTSKVILQIPSAETLAIAEAIRQWQGVRQGLLLTQKA